MASTDEFFIVHAENGVVRVQEIGVEDNLDAVGLRVEELDAADLVQDRVIVVVGHVVGRDWRQSVALQSEDTTLQQNLVFVGEKFIGSRDGAMFSAEIESDPRDADRK